ncbi:MAG: hypothetical protein SGPRY_004555, partial [Prymnesium sp.]
MAMRAVGGALCASCRSRHASRLSAAAAGPRPRGATARLSYARRADPFQDHLALRDEEDTRPPSRHECATDRSVRLERVGVDPAVTCATGADPRAPPPTPRSPAGPI